MLVRLSTSDVMIIFKFSPFSVTTDFLSSCYKLFRHNISSGTPAHGNPFNTYIHLVITAALFRPELTRNQSMSF